MSVKPPQCRLCHERHWASEPHKIAQEVSVTRSRVSVTGSALSVTTADRIIIKRTCEGCGEEFAAKRRIARFCSDRCRVAFNRKVAR